MKQFFNTLTTNLHTNASVSLSFIKLSTMKKLISSEFLELFLVFFLTVTRNFLDISIIKLIHVFANIERWNLTV